MVTSTAMLSRSSTLIVAVLLSILIFCSYVNPSPAVSKDLSYSYSWWCHKLTPYPQQCQTYGRPAPSVPINSKAAFFKLAVQSAMTTAATASKNAYSLGPKCLQDPRAKAAWDDCVQVYQLAMEHLNKTMVLQDRYRHNAAGTHQEDAQTWLSSALTYFQTCVDGFTDLGLTLSPILPLIANGDVSCLISNALAINKHGTGAAGFPSYGNGTTTTTTTSKGGWPSWLHPGDRKLLQVAGTPDVVVAQDGSGDYKTIGEAVSAAAGSGRFVIHVKAGSYSEQVSIGSNVKNVMLLGDGIGKTVITGSKSVGGGSTTFNSATVGVTGDGFIAQGITFRNTAGPSNHQAVALRSGSDLSVFYQCSFEGYQDTL
ncbi:hypothetical protein Dimus_038147 [Dionaea muscipula]